MTSVLYFPEHGTLSTDGAAVCSHNSGHREADVGVAGKIWRIGRLV